MPTVPEEAPAMMAVPEPFKHCMKLLSQGTELDMAAFLEFWAENEDVICSVDVRKLHEDEEHPFTPCENPYQATAACGVNLNLKDFKKMPWYNTPLAKALSCAAPWDAVLVILRSCPSAATVDDYDPRTGMGLLDLLNEIYRGYSWPDNQWVDQLGEDDYREIFPPFPQHDYPAHHVAEAKLVAASMPPFYTECVHLLLQGETLNVDLFRAWWDPAWGATDDHAATRAVLEEVDATGRTLLFYALSNRVPKEVTLTILNANPNAAKVAFTPIDRGPFASFVEAQYPLMDALENIEQFDGIPGVDLHDDDVVVAILKAWPQNPDIESTLSQAVKNHRSLHVIRELLLAVPRAHVFGGKNVLHSEIKHSGRIEVVQYLASYGFPCKDGTKLAESRARTYHAWMDDPTDALDADPSNYLRYDFLAKWLKEVEMWSPLRFAAASRNWQAAELGLRRPCLIATWAQADDIDAHVAAQIAAPWPLVVSRGHVLLQPPVCAETIIFITKMTRGWSPQTHHLYHGGVQTAVRATLHAAHRIGNVDMDLYLPSEIWLKCLSFLERSWWDCTVAEQ